jgi:hypothetical protein
MRSFSRDYALPERECYFIAPATQLFATYFHGIARGIMLPKPSRTNPVVGALKAREKDGLTWVMRGKTSHP